MGLLSQARSIRRRRSRARARVRAAGSRSAKSTAACISALASAAMRVGLLGAQRAVLDQPHAEARHRVAAQRRVVLLAVAEHRDRLVLLVVQRHARRSDQVAVSAQAVDLRLDQCRTVAGASTVDGGLDDLVDGDRIGAVDRDAGHRVRLGLDRQRLAGRGVGVLLLAARRDVVVVVLHDVDDRQLPQRGEVQRLGERALLAGAVAEEVEDDLAAGVRLRICAAYAAPVACGIAWPTIPEVPRKPTSGSTRCIEPP